MLSVQQVYSAIGNSFNRGNGGKLLRGRNGRFGRKLNAMQYPVLMTVKNPKSDIQALENFCEKNVFRFSIFLRIKILNNRSMAKFTKIHNLQLVGRYVFGP